MVGRPTSADLCQFLDTLPGAVVRLTRDGTIELANREASRLLGLRRDADLTGWVLDAEMFGEDGTPWSLGSLASEGSSSAPRTIRILRPDASALWAECHAVPLHDDAGQLIGATATFFDIDERRHVEEELRANERKWRLLAVQVPDFIMVADRDGRLLSINHPYPELDEASFMGQPLWAFLPEDEIDRYRARFDHSIATKTSVRFETRGYGPGGTIAWYETLLAPIVEDGPLERMLVVSRDITDKKRAEQAVQSSEHNWQILVESLPDNVVIVDRERTILSSNRSGEHPRESVIGAKADTFLDASVLEAWREQFNGVVESGLPARLETRGWSAPGRMSWYESILVPLKEDRIVARVMIVARDISERRAMLASLAEKERLASLGMVASSVAHEIMNPLTYVLANLDRALGARALDESDRSSAVTEARAGALRMRQIVSDLRLIGQLGGEDLFYVDVRRVLETAFRLCSHEVGRGGQVVLDLQEIPGVLASESQLCQVFINLLVNAAQAVASRSPADREIRVQTRHDEARNLVAIAFTDNGIGIPSEQIPHIFEPFYTTKKSGTGLGLSISRDIVKRMGGQIGVDSEPDRGTTFTVSLSTMRVEESWRE
jgi:PAS domain S-box-containing protein